MAIALMARDTPLGAFNTAITLRHWRDTPLVGGCRHGYAITPYEH